MSNSILKLKSKNEELYAAVKAFCSREQCNDTTIYTDSGWKDRHETVGSEALVSITSEGAGGFVARYEFGYAFDPKLTERFQREICDKFGVYVEIGYSWSAHLYPVPV